MAGEALQRLCKWRTVLTGWQLGTRAKGDPESDAVRDQRELLLVLRAEVSALVAVLVDKGVFTVDEFTAQIDVEAEHLCKAHERRFPGFKATDIGMEMNAVIAADTTRGWRP